MYHVRRIIFLDNRVEMTDMPLSFETRKRRGLVVLLVVMLLLSTVTGVVAAESVQGASGTIVVEEGETVSSVDALAGPS